MYAGRGTNSVAPQGFGNQHKINSLTTRDQAIKKYKETMLDNLTTEQINLISDATEVMCHCSKNQSCHVDELINFCM